MIPLWSFSHCFLYNCVHETLCFPSKLGFCDLCVSHGSDVWLSNSCKVVASSLPMFLLLPKPFGPFDHLQFCEYKPGEAALHLCGITFQNSDKQTRCWGLCIQIRWPVVIASNSLGLTSQTITGSFYKPSGVKLPDVKKKRKKPIQTVYKFTAVLVDLCMVLHHHCVHSLSEQEELFF